MRPDFPTVVVSRFIISESNACLSGESVICSVALFDDQFLCLKSKPSPLGVLVSLKFVLQSERVNVVPGLPGQLGG